MKHGQILFLDIKLITIKSWINFNYHSFFKTIDIFLTFLFQYAITVLCYVRDLVYFNLLITCFRLIYFKIGMGCLCVSHDENHSDFPYLFG